MVKRDRSGQGGTFQNVLPTMVQSICQCGCNQTFMALNMGRKRKYANDTHKKRAYRKRKTARYMDDEWSEAYFFQVLDSVLEEWAEDHPDEAIQQWAQYELMRRNRHNPEWEQTGTY